MDLKTKRQMELEYQKEQRKEEVIKVAIQVFKEQGIENTKMTDIAQRAEVGVATVYRYFNNKAELVIGAATWLWEEEMNNIFLGFYDNSFSQLNGAGKVRKVLSIFINLYRNYPEVISFLEHFDNYVIKEQISLDKLTNYEKSIIDIKVITLDALEEGKKDGSIKETIDNNAFYFTITHTLMSLSQKLILRGAVLESDSEVSGEMELDLLIEMAMSYVSN